MYGIVKRSFTYSKAGAIVATRFPSCQASVSGQGQGNHTGDCHDIQPPHPAARHCRRLAGPARVCTGLAFQAGQDRGAVRGGRSGRFRRAPGREASRAGAGAAGRGREQARRQRQPGSAVRAGHGGRWPYPAAEHGRHAGGQSPDVPSRALPAAARFCGHRHCRHRAERAGSPSGQARCLDHGRPGQAWQAAARQPHLCHLRAGEFSAYLRCAAPAAGRLLGH
ncbi:hypothetical protein D3C72_880060 [compost metagenome]